MGKAETEDDAEEADTSAESAFPEVGSEWSEPYTIREILERLDEPIPARLHTGRFQAMIQRLGGLGIIAQSLDGVTLNDEDPTPGVHAQLRLKRSRGRKRRGTTWRVRVPRTPVASALSRVTIHNFKSFDEAALTLSDLTLLIGANASGKSNALEALQLLSWMASGRKLSDLRFAIKDDHLAVRGTALDLTWAADKPILLGCTLEPDKEHSSLDFWIEVQADKDGLRVVGEQLSSPEESPHLPLYRVAVPASKHGREMQVEYNNFARGGIKPKIACIDEQPVFTQLTTPARFGATHERSAKVIPAAARRLQEALERILFLDPNPKSMRGYSFKNERRLEGDGANLSGVLHSLTEQGKHKANILSFVRSLPEQDITDISYLDGPRGDVMVSLKETFGAAPRLREAALLSDGTLRVLAIAAALFSVSEGSTVVIEEIDNGVHPSRATHLLEQIRDVASRRGLRVLLTTHNPALLDAVPVTALPDVVACYRDPKSGSSCLIKLDELTAYPELVARGPLGQLVTRGVLDRYLKHQKSSEEKRKADLEWFDSAFGAEKR